MSENFNEIDNPQMRHDLSDSNNGSANPQQINDPSNQNGVQNIPNIPYRQNPPINQGMPYNQSFGGAYPPNYAQNYNIPPQYVPPNMNVPFPNGQFAPNMQYNQPQPFPAFGPNIPPNGGVSQNVPQKEKIENENYVEETLPGDSDRGEPGKNKTMFYVSITLIILAAFAVGIFALGYFGIIKPDKLETFTKLNARPAEGEAYTVEEIGEYIRPSVVEIYVFTEKIQDDVIDSSLAYASGSGIILSESGYIVTNQHVISGAAQIEVILYDDSLGDYNLDKSYTANVIGYDTKTDIAVIKIDAAGLTIAEFGDANDAVLGEQVVAIGNPSGYTGSITMGIISGLNRKIRTGSSSYLMTCIQTDAPISPGNSGGALVNMYGQVIGITSSKIANTTVEGIGFAITVNEAKPIIDDIMEFGYVKGRYRIGIEFMSNYYDSIYEIEGIYITNIREDSDVINTELAIGDIITEINGVSVCDYDSVMEALDGCTAGDRISARVTRINNDSSVEEFEIEFELIEDTSGDY